MAKIFSIEKNFLKIALQFVNTFLTIGLESPQLCIILPVNFY